MSRSKERHTAVPDEYIFLLSLFVSQTARNKTNKITIAHKNETHHTFPQHPAALHRRNGAVLRSLRRQRRDGGDRLAPLREQKRNAGTRRNGAAPCPPIPARFDRKYMVRHDRQPLQPAMEQRRSLRRQRRRTGTPHGTRHRIDGDPLRDARQQRPRHDARHRARRNRRIAGCRTIPAFRRRARIQPVGLPATQHHHAEFRHRDRRHALVSPIRRQRPRTALRLTRAPPTNRPKTT